MFSLFAAVFFFQGISQRRISAYPSAFCRFCIFILIPIPQAFFCRKIKNRISDSVQLLRLLCEAYGTNSRFYCLVPNRPASCSLHFSLASCFVLMCCSSLRHSSFLFFCSLPFCPLSFCPFVFLLFSFCALPLCPLSFYPLSFRPLSFCSFPSVSCLSALYLFVLCPFAPCLSALCPFAPCLSALCLSALCPSILYLSALYLSALLSFVFLLFSFCALSFCPLSFRSLSFCPLSFCSLSFCSLSFYLPYCYLLIKFIFIIYLIFLLITTNPTLTFLSCFTCLSIRLFRTMLIVCWNDSCFMVR